MDDIPSTGDEIWDDFYRTGVEHESSGKFPNIDDLTPVERPICWIKHFEAAHDNLADLLAQYSATPNPSGRDEVELKQEYLNGVMGIMMKSFVEAFDVTNEYTLGTIAKTLFTFDEQRILSIHKLVDGYDGGLFKPWLASADDARALVDTIIDETGGAENTDAQAFGERVELEYSMIAGRDLDLLIKHMDQRHGIASNSKERGKLGASLALIRAALINRFKVL